MAWSWLLVDSLGVDLHTLFLGLSLFGVILSHSLLKCFSALALSCMLNSDMDSLWNDSASENLIDDNTDCCLVDIENSTSLSMIELVWHTFMDTSISNDVNVISFSVGCHYL